VGEKTRRQTWLLVKSIVTNGVQQEASSLVAWEVNLSECIGNYSVHEVATLAVDGWAVTFGTARRGLGGAAARPGSSSLYQT